MIRRVEMIGYMMTIVSDSLKQFLTMHNNPSPIPSSTLPLTSPSPPTPSPRLGVLCLPGDGGGDGALLPSHCREARLPPAHQPDPRHNTAGKVLS